MDNTSGFYRLDPNTNELQHAPNFVYAPDYTLLRVEKDTYAYPNNSWMWFDSLEEAENYFI